MNHWIIMPILLPALLAPVLVMAARYDIALARMLSVAGSVALVVLTAALLASASGEPPQMYSLGDWPAPFGIVLVLDRLSALMLVLSAVLSLIALAYAVDGWDRRGKHFHALWQFQLMGINGAFLTGDFFNLFVFFEILLIASYGLMVHGGGPDRVRAGVQYVVVNLVGSTLFLIAVGMIYSVAGTLNMADLALKVPLVAEGDRALLNTGALLLLLVFSVKAALVPVHFWLPGTYANAPAPVGALFAIMTKVGAYGIIRFYTLVFPPDLAITQGLFDTWLLPAALLTLALGMIGVLGAGRIDRLVAFSVIGSMGMLLSAVAVFTPAGIAAALFYAIHSTFAAAALFLLVDVIRDRRGAIGAALSDAPPMAGGALVAGMFFTAAIAMTGLPPLSGFVGKLLIMDAVTGTALMWWVWGVILTGSLIAIVGFSRAGSLIFWRAHQPVEQPDPEPVAAMPLPVLPMVAIGGLLALLVALTIAAGPINRVLAATSAQLFAPGPYIETVLNTPGKVIKDDAHAEDAHGDASHADDATGQEDH